MLTLLDLAGFIALLLWGLHMVETGMQRAFGADLRRMLSAALRNRLLAFATGLGVTALLQSSTATGLMASSFAARGLVELVPALALMLGANVGTTLIVQVLAFDIVVVAPILVLAGLVMFRRGGASRTRDLGRVAIGLGLMILALHQLTGTAQTLAGEPPIRALLAALASAPTLAFLLAAVVTWAAHSSIAVVLLLMSLAGTGVITIEAAFAMVLGANLGTAVNPVLEGARGTGDAAARRLPIGNLVTRAVGCAFGLLLIQFSADGMLRLEPDPARAVADFHTVFNLVMAALFFPLLSPFARLLRRWLPARADPADPGEPVYLDRAASAAPPIALAAAAREALRMADVLQEMLHGARQALEKTDRKKIAEIRRTDDVLDRLNAAIKAYLAALDIDLLVESDRRRLWETLTFATNLEQAGDVIDRDLMSLAEKRIRRGLAFMPETRAEIGTMIDRLEANLGAAASVFLTEDKRAARSLADEKEAFREIEARSTEDHFASLRAGVKGVAETSAAYLDLIRDLKRVNAHLVAAAAYPVLQGDGELLPSRLRVGGERA